MAADHCMVTGLVNMPGNLNKADLASAVARSTCSVSYTSACTLFFTASSIAEMRDCMCFPLFFPANMTDGRLPSN